MSESRLDDAVASSSVLPIESVGLNALSGELFARIEVLSGESHRSSPIWTGLMPIDWILLTGFYVVLPAVLAALAIGG